MMPRTNNSTNNKKTVTKSTPKTVDATYVEEKSNSGMSETTKGMIVGIAITALIAAVVILLILAKNNGGEDEQKKNLPQLDPAKYSETMRDFMEIYEGDDLALVVFASSQCGYCIAMKPIFENIVADYDFTHFYMDALQLTSDERVVVMDMLSLSGSTPSSVVIKDKKIVKAWEGYLEGKDFITNLIAAGIIPADSKYNQESSLTSINYTRFKDLLNGSSVSAIVVDQIACDSCRLEREYLNTLAKSNNIPIFHINTFSDTEVDDFVQNIGEWGYKEKDYLEENIVRIPLLLFVKNGKIVDYHVEYTADNNTAIRELFKKNRLIK